MARRDPSLDTLVDLHGQILVIDEAGYWVRFIVNQVPVTEEKPHGLDCSLTLHGPDGTRLVGFDNAHQVGDKRRAGQDTNIDCAPFGPTATATPRRCSRTSGLKSRRSCIKEGSGHEESESGYCVLRCDEGTYAGDRQGEAEAEEQ